MEDVRSGAGILCAGGGSKHGWGPAAGAGAGWPQWDKGCHQPFMDTSGMVGPVVLAGPRTLRGYAACVTWEAGWGPRHLVRIPHS